MDTIFISPSKYVQSAGAIKNLGKYTSDLGDKALCVITSSGYKRIKEDLDNSFADSSVNIIFEMYNGECSINEINRVVEICKKENINVVIGIGGGKTHDAAKAISQEINAPVIIVPTIASTDAPCSALSVIYSDEGVFEKYMFLKSNPNLVLVDLDIIAKSPSRLLVAGMGDALATYFEARSNVGANCVGGKSTAAAKALAKLSYDILLKEGNKAKLACENNVVSKALEEVVEANTLLSGLGFESAGLTGAHSVHNGFTVLEETHHMYHGEKVAFGTVALLVLENAPLEEINEVIDFCISVGLPVTLKELGVVDITKEKIMSVATCATAEGESIHNLAFKVSAEDVYGAILVANNLGQDRLNK